MIEPAERINCAKPRHHLELLARSSINLLSFRTLFQLRPVAGEPQAWSITSGLSFEPETPFAP